MAIKLTISDPVLVAMGPAFQEVLWGSHQFPAIHRLPDGRIAIAYSITPDKKEEYGKERGWAVSSDEGATWTEVADEDIPAVKACFGVKMPSGAYIKSISHRPYPIDAELHAKLTRQMGRRKGCIPIEDIPDEFFPKTWTFAVGKPGDTEETQYDCELDFPGMTVSLCEGAIVRPMAFGPIRVAPDGSLWIAHYWTGRNPENLGFTSYYACYYFQSTDEGKSFKLKSWIQYLPDSNDFPEAFDTEGFCEPDICWLEDGSMLTLLRTGHHMPSYIARSEDGGLTWSKPVKFDRCGVLPQLEHLGCGVTLATYGRPGLYVRATEDPKGVDWDAPIELMPYREPNLPWPHWMDSCCYTRMLPLDDRTVMMAYSDFRVKDEAGVERKCIMVRTIHVEE